MQKSILSLESQKKNEAAAPGHTRQFWTIPGIVKGPNIECFIFIFVASKKNP